MSEVDVERDVDDESSESFPIRVRLDHHQDVNVRVRSGIASGERAEEAQVDQMRSERRSDVRGELAYSGEISARFRRVGDCMLFLPYYLRDCRIKVKQGTRSGRTPGCGLPSTGQRRLSLVSAWRSCRC